MTQANTTLFAALNAADHITVENYEVQLPFHHVTDGRIRLDLADESAIIFEDQPIELDEDEAGCAIVKDTFGSSWSIRFFIMRSLQLSDVVAPEVA